MDFSQFCDSNKGIALDDKQLKNNQKNAKNQQKTYAKMENSEQYAEILQNNEFSDNLKNQISKYQKMNESELKAELIREVSKQKQSGSLDAEKLEDIRQMISPILGDEEQKRLNNLINMLK